MKTKLMTLLLGLMLFWVSSVHATVYFDVDYSNIPLSSGIPYADSNPANCGGNAACLALFNVGFEWVRGNCFEYCTMQIVNTPAFPGTRGGRSLRYEYRSNQDNEICVDGNCPQDAHGANLIKTFPSMSEFWVRSDFATDVDNAAGNTDTTSRWFCCGTKLHYWKPVGGVAGSSFITGGTTGEIIPTPVPPGAAVTIYAMQEMSICPAGGTPNYLGGGGCNNIFPNVQTVRVVDKQWYCFEYHIKLNSSASASDGVIEFFINGTMVTSYQNAKFYDNVNATASQARFNQVEIFRQHANHMIRYEKNFTVASTRAEAGGCLGGPAPTDPIIGLSPTSLSFGAVVGNSPANQTVSVFNSGAGTLSWAQTDNQSWLTVTPGSGTDSGTLTFSVASSALAIGTYSATVTVTASGANNTPQTIPVTLTITAAPSPTISSLTNVTRTQATVGTTGSPPNIRVCVEVNGYCENVLTSSLVAGVVTFSAAIQSNMTDYVCIFAVDGTGAVNVASDDYKCAPAPVGTDTSPPSPPSGLQIGSVIREYTVAFLDYVWFK